ncbi:hypothetical protein F5876DRAFT_76148 [Lentinula aff. lateritia]|uniref:Uncharacterized protein n=1 Tax=Lentinula aff. lateritia TaxID=2804960 RepID=A0ACC1U300_9AGAR|nr:hypothetical protein F5876DRAFT_76148 [Lentinula aff. lateritia]
MSSSTPWLSNSFTTSSQLDVDPAALSSLLQDTSSSNSTSSELSSSGQFASFVTLVSGLEQNLHNEDPLFLDLDVSFNPNRTLIASGASSRVEKATWNSSNFKGKSNKRWGNSVALKFTRYHTDTNRTATNWKHLLSEVRALLHEPIRYHPNIVRLLGISWGATDGMRSNFPALVLELSELGTLAHLQMNESQSLPFDVKKKLCWDVAKGISILHACGVVHGDLKHENVLVYPNRDSNATVKYVAKISDFGGSVMDLGLDQFRTLYTPTQLWLAPEFFVKTHMSEAELKLTDVYALGLLVWRTIIDGKNPYQQPVSNAEPMLESQIYALKCSNNLISMAKESVLHHELSIAPDGIQILHYIFDNTIQFAPSSRNLVRTIAALQVNKISETEELLENARKKNEEHNELLKHRVLVPGQHGLTQDGLGVYLAQTNATTGDYDYQHAGPGFRPTIRSPPQGEFRFEPLRLKAVLNWKCQTMLIHDLEAAALIDLKGTDKPSAPTQMIPAIASFHAFKCYCYEFGTKFESVKACHWLKFTASCDVECPETNLARAWCWRFHKAFNVDLDMDSSKTLSRLCWAINNGHRKCIVEGNSILQDLMTGSEMRAFHGKELLESYRLLSTCGGGVGMPFFVPGKLRRLYHMDDFAALEQDIQAEMTFRGVQSVDEIYVNGRGDSLLHMAAALGRLGTLKYLVETYHPNINKANSSREETPLVSACRGGHLDCALYLLDLGATPEGDRFSLERPLWWLSSFKEDEIPRIAVRLVMAGASLTFPQSPAEFSTLALSRGQLRSKYVWADYDNFFLLPASPLSRAVMMESLPAVRALLTLGAHPLEGYRDPKLKLNTGLSVCPIVVAAALAHSHILKVFLDHIDSRTARPIRLFSEIEMLEMALDSKVTIGDPMSVDRRVARLGPAYQESLTSTLRMLHDREIFFQQDDDEAKKLLVAKGSADMLYRLASVGQIDILRILLQLGHSARGYAEVFPIVAAVQANNEPIFQLLVDYGADLTALYDLPYLKRKRTLLQVLAERPHNTIIGGGIAQALLEQGVPVDFVNPGGLDQEKSDLIVSRPAFSSAVLRQDFELADLCLNHGANVDLTYVHRANVAKITVFGELVCNPTEKNQDSLQYLLGLEVPPSYIVSPTVGWSVLFHASFFWATTDMQRRILGQMVRMIVAKDIYSSEEVMRYAPHAQVQAIGFPFVLALMGNLEVFTALLDCIPRISQNPHTYFEYEEVKLSLILRAIIAKFPQLPEHISAANSNLGITNDKTMDKEWMERYKLILYRLEEIQQ